MASGASEVSICNLALSHLGEAPITALADDTKPARECLRLYAATRDALLRAHNWNFAIQRTNLAEDPTAPDWGFGHRFQLPPECLRVVDVRYSSEWRVEGGYILADQSGPLYIRFVARISDTAIFDVLFVKALGYDLAAELAIALTQNNTMVQAMHELRAGVVMQAQAMDAIESSARRPPEGSWVTARR